jgi:hypothetical protein
MASARGTFLAEGFSQKLLKEVYDKSILDSIVNRDYEGEINAVGSKLNILNIARISEKTYDGDDLTADSLYENETELVIDQYKSFYWKEKTLDNWLSYIKDPHSTVITQKADERNKNMDTYAFGLYGDVAAGNRVGTDYDTGTVTVTATSGAVTGSGTTFTAAMVGKGFKAEGHTKWYRVKTYNNATSIVIEDDLDDVDSAYTGGAIAGGATYEVEAATPISITTANLLGYVADLRTKLDKAEANGVSAVPDSDRWLIVPPEFENTLVQATGVALHVPEVYTNLVQKGFLGMLLGFKLFKSNRLSGDNTDGYHILAGHPNWLTFAEKLLEADIEEDLIGNFGSAYKDLFVYGAKVSDTRRQYAAELFATFA